MTEKGLLTLREVAETLRESPQSTRRRIERGELQALKLGSEHGRLRIRSESVDRFLEEGRALDSSGGMVRPKSSVKSQGEYPRCS